MCQDLIEYNVSLSLKHLLLHTAPEGHCKVVDKVEWLLKILQLPPPQLGTGNLLALWRVADTPEKHLDEFNNSSQNGRS